MDTLSHSSYRSRHIRGLSAIAAGLLCVTAMPLPAATIASEFGSAGPSFWAIVTNSNSPHLNVPGTINGNVAVTKPGTVLSLHSSNPFAIDGNVVLSTGSGVSHPAEVTGSITANQALMTQVLTDATNAAAFFTGLAANNALSALTTTQTINSSGPGATNIFHISNATLGSNVLTLNGDANSQFIFDITSGDLRLSSGMIDLTGGLLSTDVLFNIESGDLATSGGLNNESVINAIVLGGASTNVHMSRGSINGELIALSTGTFRIVSGGSVNMTPPPAIPEPQTYSIVGLGLLVLVGMAWRRCASALRS